MSVRLCIWSSDENDIVQPWWFNILNDAEMKGTSISRKRELRKKIVAKHGGRIEGSEIVFDDDSAATLFLLRWS